MSDHGELFTIGQLARSTGLSTRTIRFWSDLGVIPPTARSAGGYRLYDAAAAARLDLVRTLRELGLNLETVQQVVRRQVTVADVARAHANALDAEIRTLQLRRAVLRSVAQRGSTTEEMRLVHDLARLSARERQRMIDEFVDTTFADVDPGAPGAGIGRAMRLMPAELPDDPTPEQVDAWVELAELVGDESFRERVRAMAIAGTDTPAQQPYDATAILEHAGGAVAEGIAPDSAQGKEILDRVVDPATSAADRARLADELAAFTDRRVERYWQLMGMINGRPAFPPRVPTFEWFIEALRAHR